MCSYVHILTSLQVYGWLSERGWVFLTANAFIGGKASEAQSLIKQHDSFEVEAKVKKDREP